MSSVNGDRPVPYSVTAERALLGSILIDNGSYDLVSSLITSDVFLIDRHRTIFRRMARMRQAAQPIDLVTLVDALKVNGELESVGGPAEVASLADGVPRISNVRSYSSIIKKNAFLRELINLCQRVQDQALESDADPTKLLLAFGEQIATLSHSSTSHPNWEALPGLEVLAADHVEWLVPQIIPVAGFVLLTGEPGSMKSFLAQFISKVVASGGEFLGSQCLRSKVFYLDRENPSTVWVERIRNLHIPREDPNIRLLGNWSSPPPPNLDDPFLLEVAKRDKPLMIFDSLVRFHRADENSATEMASVMENFRRLTNAGAAALSIHHRGKSESSRSRGSSELEAAPDVVLMLKKKAKSKKDEAQDDDRTLTLNLRCVKNRFGPEFSKDIRVDLSAVEVFRPAICESDAKRREITKILVDLMDETPLMNQTQLLKRTAHEFSRTGKTVPSDKALAGVLRDNKEKLWEVQDGRRRSKLYVLKKTAFTILDD